MLIKLAFVCLFCLVVSFALAQQAEKFSLEEGLGYEGLNYEVGRAIFEKIWVSSPSSTTASDGLGPLYNARSCVSCHQGGGRGDVANSLVLHVNDEAYGKQLQTFSVVGMKSEAKVSVYYSDIYREIDDTVLQQPAYSISGLQYGAAPAVFSPRIASSLAGLGLLALIPEQVIADLADETDEDADGISGRMNRVWDREQQQESLGRFGWKASQSTLRQQIARAFSLDIGISTSVYPDAYGDCSKKQKSCLAMPNGNSAQHDNVEAGSVMLESLLFYISNIPVPVKKEAYSEAFARGKALFDEAACSACHYSEFEVDGRMIEPYTDLLLHDMGEGLADAYGFGSADEGLAIGREWRTAPLWGITRAGVQGAYLHDGRARSLQEAILWHGGEAKNSLDRYTSMAKGQRDDLISFLNEL